MTIALRVGYVHLSTKRQNCDATRRDAGPLPFVYADLRQIAVSALRGPQAHATLPPSALINDVFVRLLGAQSVDITNRKHFFATAAKLTY